MPAMRCSFYTRGQQCTKTDTTAWKGYLVLCQTHRRRHLLVVRRLTDGAVGRHIAEGAQQQIENMASRKTASQVYFIRAGHRIKIGRSIDPQQRLYKIRANGSNAQKPLGLDTSNARLLATLPGHHDEERALHERFAHLREKGEWFRAKPELMDYINSLTRKAAA